MIDNETLARESENLYACLKDDDKDIGLQMFADEHSAAIESLASLYSLLEGARLGFEIIVNEAIVG